MRLVAPKETEGDGSIERILNDLFWPDGESRTTGREFNGLSESACFTKGTLSCISCHQLHQRDTEREPEEWADDQLKFGYRNSNTVCLKCHDAEDYEQTRHTHHAASSTGSLCYNCHMPHTTYGLLGAIRAHKITSPSVKVNLETKRPNACNLCHLDKTLQWTAMKLNEWYEHPVPAIDEDDRNIATGVLWSLRGDALQRALTAWSMGWKPAHKAAGDEWMSPYLAELMTDNYDAIRQIARASLKKMKGFKDFRSPFLAPLAVQKRDAQTVVQAWLKQPKDFSTESRLLIEDGRVNLTVYKRLLEARDHTVFNLPE